MALQFALNRLFVVTANLGSVFEDVSPAVLSLGLSCEQMSVKMDVKMQTLLITRMRHLVHTEEKFTVL